MTETDPHGIPAHKPGSKLDNGKQIAGEIIIAFPRAMRELIKVSTYGATKYSRHGFLKVKNAELRYMDAAMRHLLAMGCGEDKDSESGLSHLTHAFWNLGAIIEIKERKNTTHLRTEGVSGYDNNKP